MIGKFKLNHPYLSMIFVKLCLVRFCLSPLLLRSGLDPHKVQPCG